MTDRHARHRLLACSLAILALAAPLAARAADPDLDPARKWNLERVGQAWITSHEAEIRRRLAAVPELESRITALELSLRTALADNAIRWKQRSELERGLEQLRQGSSGLGSAERAARDEEIRRIQQQLLPLRTSSFAPEKLGSAPDVRAQLVDLTQIRTSALVAASVVRELAPRLADDYKRLAKEPLIAEWLKATKSRLGPLKNYDSDLRKLIRLEEQVLGSPLWEGGTPLWIEADRFRLGAIANENLPVTFTWDDSVPAAIVTMNWQQAAGLEAEPGRAKETLRIAGRTFSVRHYRLAYLRLGRTVVRDVDCLVLPPEGEDLGCRLSAAALHGQRAAIEPAQLRLRLLASDSAK